jgi:hypothetical protein
MKLRPKNLDSAWPVLSICIQSLQDLSRESDPAYTIEVSTKVQFVQRIQLSGLLQLVDLPVSLDLCVYFDD